MILHARVEPSPADPSSPAPVSELRAEGATYEAARDALLALVPDGHRVTWMMRDSYV